MSLLLVLLVITGFVFLVLAAFSVAQIGRFQWLPGGLALWMLAVAVIPAFVRVS